MVSPDRPLDYKFALIFRVRSMSTGHAKTACFVTFSRIEQVATSSSCGSSAAPTFQTQRSLHSPLRAGARFLSMNPRDTGFQ